MKKNLMITLACGALVLATGLTVVGCGGGPTTEIIDKAEMTSYIESATMNFNKGYKYSVENDSMNGYAEVVKNGSSIDAKILMTKDNEDHAMYLKDGQGFEETENGLEKMADISEVVKLYSTPFVDCSTFMQPFVASDTTEVTKTVDGENITFTYVDKLAAAYQQDGVHPVEPSVKYDINMKLTFSSNMIVKFEAKSADSDFDYSFVYEEFAGPVNFAGVDLTAYNKTFDFNGLSITLTNKFVSQDALKPQNADAYLVSSNGDVAFVLSHEDVSSYPQLQNMTELQYAQTYITSVLNQSGISSTAINDTENNLVYFKYDNIGAGRLYSYFAVVKKNNNGVFYLCQLGCYQSKYSSMKEQFIKWAKTITVKG